jgi:UDPglucose--hexose-1-phosphate uridylyltransferase
MCPGNTRAGGESNPTYTSTYVFGNDFPALKPETPQEVQNERDLIVAQGERGICRVVCFSPQHDLTLARMEVGDIRLVVDLWAEQYRELGALSFISWVQIFENRGAMMGASNPHPHCQIWASSNLPNEAAKEQASLSAYHLTHGHSLLGDYLEMELEAGERLVCQNDHFAVVVPFWAIWPFETLVISKRPISGLDKLNDEERDGLAAILKLLTTRYENLFEVSFPYSAGFHQRPTDGLSHPEWHLHMHFFPPLLRSARVRKFMVGYEMLGTPQRDITPEAAAEQLRGLSDIHYRAVRGARPPNSS